jgi:hypothetical protein
MSEKQGLTIILDWYDGPLCEIAPVDFSDGHRLVLVSQFVCGEVEELRGGAKWAGLRLDRETLQAALDLLDGKPVADYQDALVVVPRAIFDEEEGS